MNIRILILFISFPFIASGQQSDIDVLHYKFNIELNDNNDTIRGTTSIVFLVNKDVLNVSFDLVKTKANGKGMTVNVVSFPSRSALPPNINFTNDKLTLTPMHGFNKGDTAEVIITYKGIPEDGLIISKNKYGHRTFFADNWPNRAHHWIPCVDDPADKATVEFLVTAPEHYQVVSNGIQVEETNLSGNRRLTYYKEDVSLPTKVMVIGVAAFAVDLAGMVGSIPVYSWVYPEDKQKGFYDYALAKDVVAYYINYIGPFPYKKLANVQSKTIFGGMENAGAIFYHENSIDGHRGEEYLLAHEIVHQWFGDMATEKSFPHLWLSEGFATYLTHIYSESKAGHDKFIERMKNDRDEIIDFVKTSPKPVVDSATAFLQLLNPNSYQRGSWVLHMLRRQLGDDVFKRSVRAYYEQYKGKNAETRDLQVVFEKTSGKKLDTFFRQWLFRAEIPKLDITWKYDAAKKNISVTIKQLQKGGLFSFPLSILVAGSPQSQPVSTVFNVTGRTETETFFISTQSLTMVQNILIDPLASLLFDGTIKKL